MFLNKYNCVINLKMLTYLGSKILVDKIFLYNVYQSALHNMFKEALSPNIQKEKYWRWSAEIGRTETADSQARQEAPKSVSVYSYTWWALKKLGQELGEFI